MERMTHTGRNEKDSSTIRHAIDAAVAERPFVAAEELVEPVTVAIHAYGLHPHDARIVADQILEALNQGVFRFVQERQFVLNITPMAAALDQSLETMLGLLVEETQHGISPENVERNILASLHRMRARRDDEGS